MDNIVSQFFTSFLKYWIEGLSDMLDSTLDKIVDIAFNADKYMNNLLGGGTGFTEIFNIAQKFGLALITLMFLKKGFDTYVAWTDDPETDPLDLIVNYLKAMIVALSFSYLYTLLVDVMNELINDVLAVVFSTDNFSADNMKNMLLDTMNSGISTLNIIFILVLLVCYIIMYLQFLVRGLEIFILRVGIPIAACGLINNNKGVFAPYLNKLIQSLFSVFVQVVLWKMSFALALSSNYMWAVAAIVLAIKTPKFLSEFIAPTSSGVGASVRTAGQAVQTIRMIRR